MVSYCDYLACSACLITYAATALMNVCTCGAPLLARYRLGEAAAALDRDRLEGQTLWRYHAMLPVQLPAGVVSLGEGMTPAPAGRAAPRGPSPGTTPSPWRPACACPVPSGMP